MKVVARFEISKSAPLLTCCCTGVRVPTCSMTRLAGKSFWAVALKTTMLVYTGPTIPTRVADTFVQVILTNNS